MIRKSCSKFTGDAVSSKVLLLSFLRPDRQLLVLYPSSDESTEILTADTPKIQTDHDAPTQCVAVDDSAQHEDQPMSRFKPLSTDEVLRELSVKKFTPSTERKTNWAVLLYEEWRKQRIASVMPETQIVFADIRSKILWADNFCYSLSAFLNEVKRSDSFEFGGKGLYSLVIMLQFFLEKQGLSWKLIDNPEFVRVRYTLDNLMKSRAADRVSITKSACPISFADEEKMWLNGSLGEDTPEKLHNTVMYLLGLSCALRGGQEHRNLRCPGHDCQFTVCTDSASGATYLQYVEDEQKKTNQGGLQGRRSERKVVKIWGNPDPTRDVRLFLKYTGLLPIDGKSEALYKYPLSDKKLTGKTWYADKPVGVNSLKKIVGNLAKEAGLVGHFTNHSLCAMAATRMYNGGVDEQVIKEITGHKSDSVRAYKHTNVGLLKRAASTIVDAQHDQSLTETDRRFLLPSKKDVPAEPRSKLPPDFDIDQVPLRKVDPQVKCVVEDSRVPLHSGHCPVADETGKCLPICHFLTSLDQKHIEGKVKKMQLSLKYQKK